ncbi:NAD(P)/FAD-dependent oxidoreductase [Variovorax dokdonensis]|uniref:NAD(P)/FAD-dependent oxidoreductase n=1 Tax=Variovorax dokdonensis TaxID=344883 RepID=A0ABT7N9Y8_9BURK|nr:NAD(P)/FAD-dependent oxidoreductase [Variovorax dokdonensis]MDM0044675.1 NAD(P)/FAD-dependent oxidoreductase [Variovorax dokdonensis]
MSTPAAQLNCDVLVIGAGPAGSACARVLARAGIDVLLCDRQEFPRDKVCGDGLIADSHRALARLGLLDAVLAQAAQATHLACHAPSGGTIELPATLSVLRRRELDELLRQAALASGARWLAPARFTALLVEPSQQVAGARLGSATASVEVHARWTVLATGADATALEAAGVAMRRAPSGMALRGYVRHAARNAHERALEVVWHRALRGGYGWIFPVGSGVFNIGVGYMHSRAERRRRDASGGSLRDLWNTFLRVHPAARELMADGVLEGELKGAPLRCSLEGSAWSRPGLLVAGEAAGSTYLFTGEGIGKALESGMAAAQAIIDSRRAGANGPDGADAQALYQASMDALRPRFAAYALANRFNEHPWLVDFILWRARRDPALAARLAGVLDESEDPSRFASLSGLLRSLWPG